MLKKVVLPAPLGPMIETIDRRGIENDTSLTATRPPKIFETPGGLEEVAPRAGGAGGRPLLHRAAHTPCVPSCASSTPMPSVSSSLRRRSGISPSGRRIIISTSRKP